MLVAVLTGVVALAACGGSSGSSEPSAQSLDDVFAAVDGLSGKARTDKLVELAKEEGGVDVYTSSAIDYMTELAGAFEDAYDVDVSTYKTSSEALVQRMIEENKAGFHGSDVAETNTPGLLALDDEGIITPYASPSTSKLVAGSAGKSWIDDKSNTFVVAWNTKRVPKGDEPTSLEDLADPRWKGRLVLEADDSDWYKASWDALVASGKTPAEADKIFEGVARNAAFVNGHSLMADLVAAGEFDVTVDSYLHTVRGLQKKGAPLSWQPAVEPLVTRPDGIAVVAHAKHPAAALLFVDFTLDQGQQVFADFFLTPARKDLSVPESIGHVAMDVADYVAHQDEWAKRYEQLVRLGKVGPEG